MVYMTAAGGRGPHPALSGFPSLPARSRVALTRESWAALFGPLPSFRATVGPSDFLPPQPIALIWAHPRVDQNCRKVSEQGLRRLRGTVASSSGVTTRSRWCSPGKSASLGADSSTPHSTARFRIRRSTRIELLIELTASPRLSSASPLPRFCKRVCSCTAKPATFSLVISSNVAFASDSQLLSRRIPARNQNQLFTHVCSKVAFAHGSTRVSQNSFRVGTGLFSRIPNFSLCKRCLVCCLHLPRHLVIALLRRLPHRAALPHELVPVHFPTLVDTHDSPRLLFCFATALRSAAELAPFLHLADEFLLAPLLLAGLGALASQEACCLVHVRHE